MEEVSNKKFVSYLDDNDNVVSGYFFVQEITENWVVIKTDQGNILRIPSQRVLKIKEKGEDYGP